jgi:Skp family chaperone for outer membrane proteins
MNTHTGNRTGLAGWLIAAVLGGMMVGSGFQDGKEKYGVVDLRKVIVDSKIDTTVSDKVEAARKARLAVLTFIRDHRVITEEQALRLRTLELKETRTDAETTELTQLKATIDTAGKEYERLNAITTPTEAERQTLMSMSRTFQTSGEILRQYQDDFEMDFTILREQAQQDAIDRAAKAAAVVAKAKGYTVMFSSTAVVFAANDITADAVKEADK